jgi:hypothetical protein
VAEIERYVTQCLSDIALTEEKISEVKDFMVDPFIMGNQLSCLLLNNQDVTIDDFSNKNLKIRDKDHLLFVISTSCLIK